MLTIVQGKYCSGKIELEEQPGNVPDETPVIVTFLQPSSVDLGSRGIDVAQAVGIRAQLAAFAEDWDRPDMSLYDAYDAGRAQYSGGY